jgi:UDP-glucose 4-epimerase
MNFLLIGGNGFIGSHLIDKLLQNNHYVRVYDLNLEKFREPIKQVDYIISSTNEIDELITAMKDIDIVIHLASSSVPSTSNLDPISDINGNLINTLNILNSIIKSKVKKIVYFSSGGAIYEPSLFPLKEESKLNPISSYGIVKETTEKYLNLYSKLYNIETLIFRPSNPYGPRQGHFIAQGVITTFLKKVLLEEKIIIFGDATNIKDYIFIEDLCNISYKIISNHCIGTYNLGSGIGTSLNEIVDTIKKVTNKVPIIEHENQKNYDIPNFVLDTRKVQNEIGQYKFTNLEFGIYNTWNWIKENKK